MTFVLDQEKIANLGSAINNNYCRNPDGDVGPWCIAPNGEFDYCDIPACNSTRLPEDLPGDNGGKISNNIYSRVRILLQTLIDFGEVLIFLININFEKVEIQRKIMNLAPPD